jgi:carbon storage regulator CsrA
MLVLSRKSRESVVVLAPDGESCQLRITVLEIAPGRVRLGFQGGTEVPVHRWEVWQKMVAGRECLTASDPRSAAGDRSTAHAEANPQALVVGEVLHSLFQPEYVV